MGEDFQTTYELGLIRHASGHSEVLVGKTKPYVIDASSALSVDLGFEIRQAFSSQSFVRSKAAQRAKNRASRDERDSAVTAAEDVLIAAHSVHNVKVDGPFGNRSEWLVEKVIMGLETQDLLAAPTTWINTDHPYLAIANPSPRPVYVRTGDIVGRLVNPETLDKFTGEAATRAAAAADMIQTLAATRGFVRPETTVIGSTLREQDLSKAANPPKATDDQLDSDDQWGPKTTSVPEPSPRGELGSLVNLGPNIPSEYRDKLAEVLRRNESAFRVDG